MNEKSRMIQLNQALNEASSKNKIDDKRWQEMNDLLDGSAPNGWQQFNKLLYKYVTKDKIKFEEFNAIMRSKFFR